MEDENIVILADGLEDAFIGIAESFGGKQHACYSYDKVIEILMNMNMSYDEAVEYYEYNILGAFYKDNMPFFLDLMNFSEFKESYEKEKESNQ